MVNKVKKEHLSATGETATDTWAINKISEEIGLKKTAIRSRIKLLDTSEAVHNFSDPPR